MTDIAMPPTFAGAFILVFITMTGLVVWIVKRLFDHTIPEQQKLFKEELAAERSVCQNLGEIMQTNQRAIEKTLEISTEILTMIQRNGSEKR